MKKMKKIIILLYLILIAFNVIGQVNLTIGNGDTYNASANTEFLAIDMNNGSTLNIPFGITITCSTLIIRNSAIINLDGILIVTGNVDTKNNSILTVNSTGSMDVGGDFDNKGSVINDGIINVDGNYTGPIPTGDGTTTDNGGIIQGTPLPVIFDNLYTRINSNVITLTWITYSEINNDYFILETSPNMREWYSLATIDGNGTTSYTSEYSYVFKQLGDFYIRLRQFDYNGNNEILVSGKYISNQLLYTTYIHSNNVYSFINAHDEKIIYIIGIRGTQYAINSRFSPGVYFGISENNKIKFIVYE